jgi:hypothetical protein
VGTPSEIKLPAASHSFHTAWDQCPRKAWHGYIARDIERADTAAMQWGTRVHTVLDKYFKGEPLPDTFQHYAHLYEFPPGYSVQSELKLGIDDAGRACEFFADNVYARGVLDLVLRPEQRDDMAILIDHKTGKVREHPAELELHAALLQVHYPELRTIKGWYNWLSTGKMGAVHDLSDTQHTLQRLAHTQRCISNAFKLGADAFPPRQSPLCGWCPVKQCEFNPCA